MSKTGGTTRTISGTAPPEFQMPYIKQMLQGAQNLYQAPTPRAYEGPTIAPFSPNEVWAQQGLTKQAGGVLPEIADYSTQAFNWGLKNLPNPETNPYVASTAAAAARPITENLMNVALPELRSIAVGAGGRGGTRESLASGLATGQAAKAVGDVSTGIYNNAYNTGLQAWQNILGMAPMIQQLQLTPSMVLGDVGAQQRAMEQAKLDEEANKYYYNTAMPWNVLNEYANTVRGPLGGTGYSTVEAPETGTASQITGSVMQLLPLIRMIAGYFGG